MQNNRLNVLFFSHSAELYGSERSLINLIEILHPNLINAFIVIPSKGPIEKELSRIHAPYIIIPFTTWIGRKNLLFRIFRLSYNLIFFPYLYFRLRKCNFDLLYTNTGTMWQGGLLALLWKKPHIYHLREFFHDDLPKYYDFGKRFSLFFLSQTGNRFITNSIAIKNYFRKYIGSDKINSIYNGLVDSKDSTLYSPKSLINHNKVLNFCMVGNIRNIKNQLEALQAFKIVIDSGIDAKLIFVGSGEPKYLNKLKAYSAREGLSERIQWVGFQNHPEMFMRQSDLTLVCSTYEPFGRVAIESMSVGTPVIATNVDGLAEIIQDGVNGLLYEKGNYLMLSQRILQIISNPKLYYDISKNGLSIAYKKFNKEKYAMDIYSLLSEIKIN